MALAGVVNTLGPVAAALIALSPQRHSPMLKLNIICCLNLMLAVSCGPLKSALCLRAQGSAWMPAQICVFLICEYMYTPRFCCMTTSSCQWSTHLMEPCLNGASRWLLSVGMVQTIVHTRHRMRIAHSTELSYCNNLTCSEIKVQGKTTFQRCNGINKQITVEHGQVQPRFQKH